MANLNESGENDLDGGNGAQGQYGDRYYREFKFQDISPEHDVTRKQNTENLIAILDQILTNPYDVLIGTLS